MPLQQTAGNNTYDAYGGGVAVAANYIEDVFSTYLYTGTGAAQTITNNINLSGSGGLVWIKSRSAATNNNLFDTAQGTTKLLHSNTNDATVTDANSLTAFGTTGFTLGTGNTSGNEVNTSSATYVSWTFRKQQKFFDIVTYTGNGTARTIAHNLGSVPGCIIVKSTSATAAGWRVYHRSTGNTRALQLETASPTGLTGVELWNNTSPTSTVFSLGTSPAGYDTNESGVSYVAYIFAHDAGGFGLTGTDNVISCGSFASNAGGTYTATLGWEPQFVLVKETTFASNWWIYDILRGMPVGSIGVGGAPALFPNLPNAEGSQGANPFATGFSIGGNPSTNAIYIAIRRGPMKVPTVGTSVFIPIARTGTDVNTVVSNGFAPDLFIGKYRGYASGPYAFDRLRWSSVQVRLSDLCGAEQSGQDSMVSFNNTSVTVGVDTYAYNTNNSISNLVNYFFGRAPNFFDIVCDTGTGVAHTVAHNLGAAPELILRKIRNAGFSWNVYYGSPGNFLQLDQIYASAASATIWNNTAPTSSVFSVGGSSLDGSNASGYNYLSYLFATCPGVSKVGTYTGNGTTQTINCGFTSGARFVLIKKTSATGDWYVYDTARGMTTITDPYVLFNSTDVETATLGSVTTVSTGFALNSAILAAINTNAATYIFLAIA
jgi:hypothetical protein